MLTGLVIAGFAIAAVTIGLSLSGGSETSADTASLAGPASVEHIEGSDLSRVTLSERAIERLDIQTIQVREETVSGTPRHVIPYSAVLYDPDGTTWAYTNPEPSVFVRHQISVDYIDGDIAVLTDGPPIGTTVVTVGATELYGTEYGVGH
jgi:hypothetical protein